MSKTAHKLTDEMRAFLVKELACFTTPGEAVAKLKEHYGVEITKQTAEWYDPTKVQVRRGSHLKTARWTELFEKCRKDFLTHMENTIPESNRAVRVRMYAEAARRAEKAGNDLAMAEHLQHIAKEMGEVHTNIRRVANAKGEDFKLGYANMTDQQIFAELARILGSAEAASAALGVPAVLN